MAVIINDSKTERPVASSQAFNIKYGSAQGAKRARRETKDVLLAAVTTQSGTKSAVSMKAAPSLPTPAKPFTGVQGGDSEGNDNMSLIAIIGMVLALQAKTSSNYWSNLWKQATESMNMQVNFAPIVAKAIKSSYDAQVSATQNEAKGARGAGIAQLVAFGLSLCGGAVSTYKGMGSEQITQDTKNLEPLGEEDTAAAAGVGEVEEGLVQTESDAANASSATNGDEAAAVAAKRNMEEKDQLLKVEGAAAKGKAPAADEAGPPGDENTSVDPLDPEDKVYSIRATKLKNALSKMFTSKNLTAMYENSLRAGQLAGMLGQGSQQVTQAHYQGKVALFRGIQGQAEAVKSLSEMLAQYYGQNFSRANELTSGAQQSIDTVMNILTSASQAVTGAINSMFRG